MPVNVKDIQDEDRRARHVQFIFRFASNVIMQGEMSRREGEALVAAARSKILDLFPGRESTYELLYGHRFRRLLDEFTRPEPSPRRPGVVVPFPDQGSR